MESFVLEGRGATGPNETKKRTKRGGTDPPEVGGKKHHGIAIPNQQKNRHVTMPQFVP